MSEMFNYLTGQPWFETFATVVVIASGITATLKDRYAERIPVIGKIWPILNWLSMNVGHNENKADGMDGK